MHQTQRKQVDARIEAPTHGSVSYLLSLIVIYNSLVDVITHQATEERIIS